jgi:hypothetical protein
MTTPQDTALKVLTAEWQSLPSLRQLAGFTPDRGAWGFDDLVVAGLAEVKRTPIIIGRKSYGERTWFRRVRP